MPPIWFTSDHPVPFRGHRRDFLGRPHALITVTRPAVGYRHANRLEERETKVRR